MLRRRPCRTFPAVLKSLRSGQEISLGRLLHAKPKAVLGKTSSCISPSNYATYDRIPKMVLMSSFFSFVDRNDSRLRYWAVLLLIAFFLVSGLTNLRSGIADADVATCLAKGDTDATSDLTVEQRGNVTAGRPEILDVKPERTTIDGRVCLVVAGVVSKETETKVAAGEAAATTSLWLYLNDQAVSTLKVEARSVSDPQVLILDLAPRGETDDNRASIHRALFRSVWSPGERETTAKRDPGFDGWIRYLVYDRPLTVGLSLTQSDSPQTTSSPIRLVIFSYVAAFFGLISLSAFLLLIVSLAMNTTILRDNNLTVRDVRNRLASIDGELADIQAAIAGAESDPTRIDTLPALRQKLDELSRSRSPFGDFMAKLAKHRPTAGDELPAGSYSLSRTQLAIWIALVVGCFLYLWAILGQFNGLITDSVLVLLGLNGLATIAAIEVSKASAATWPSRSFRDDILEDSGGPSLHRFQAITWTLILAALFVWNVFFDLRFTDFDDQLLILLGISQGMYVGFKYQAQPTKE